MSPAETTITIIPIPLPRSSGGKTVVTMLVPIAWNIAAPIAWITRATTSVPMDWAKTHRIEPVIKSVYPNL